MPENPEKGKEMFFTNDEIREMLPDKNKDYVFEDNVDNEQGSDRYIRVRLLGTDAMLDRICAVFGIDLNNPHYSKAWVDAYADLHKFRYPDGRTRGICTGMYFRLQANTGNNKEDHDINLVFTNAAEQEAVFDQIAGYDERIRKMYMQL